MTLNQLIKEISIWNTPLISCTAPYRSSNKKITCKNLGQYRYSLIIQIFDNSAPVQFHESKITGVFFFFFGIYTKSNVS